MADIFYVHRRVRKIAAGGSTRLARRAEGKIAFRLIDLKFFKHFESKLQ
jgi:hypothetical protein